MEPNSEYLTTSTLCCQRANSAIISSVAFPHVAFRSPPTAIYLHTIHIILEFLYKKSYPNIKVTPSKKFENPKFFRNICIRIQNLATVSLFEIN